MFSWLRRSFIAGFFVTVPLFITVAAILWLFRLVDGLVGPLYIKLLGPELVPPGLGISPSGVEAKIPLQAGESRHFWPRAQP